MPKQKRPRLDWFRLFPADFVHGTKEMTNEEVGAFFRLMCEAWLNSRDGKQPPFVENRTAACLAAMPHTSRRDWDRIRRAVLSKFTSTDLEVKGGDTKVLLNKRLIEEQEVALGDRAAHQASRLNGTQSSDVRPTGVRRVGVHREREREIEGESEPDSAQQGGQADGDAMIQKKQRQKGLHKILARTWQEVKGSTGAVCPYPRGGFQSSFEDLADTHDHDVLIDAFRLWAKEGPDPSRVPFPIEEFMKEAGDYMLKARPPVIVVDPDAERKKKEQADRQRELERTLGGPLPDGRDKPRQEGEVTNLEDLL